MDLKGRLRICQLENEKPFWTEGTMGTSFKSRKSLCFLGTDSCFKG